MNNPALPLYASQTAGRNAFSGPHANPAHAFPSGVAIDHVQTPFQHSLQIAQPPSHPYQAHQLISQQLYQQPRSQFGAGSRPQSRSYIPQAQGRPSNGSTPATVRQGTPPTSDRNQLSMASSSGPSMPPMSSTTDVNTASQGQGNATLAQQAQLQNATRAATHPQQPQSQQQTQQTGANGSVDPQAAAREKARVTVLLEINTHLLQEVVSLQAQGKAGTTPNQGQPPPTSPTSATDPTSTITNSPGEPPKSAGGVSQAKSPSQEYAECMRRLQANLSYLAAIADAKKKVHGALPPGPAIMIPPPHLAQVTDLYKQLNTLFPEAAKSNINKAMAQAASQGQNANKTQQSVAASALAQG